MIHSHRATGWLKTAIWRGDATVPSRRAASRCTEADLALDYEQLLERDCGIGPPPVPPSSEQRDYERCERRRRCRVSDAHRRVMMMEPPGTTMMRGHARPAAGGSGAEQWILQLRCVSERALSMADRR